MAGGNVAAGDVVSFWRALRVVQTRSFETILRLEGGSCTR
jgi:hypothetical protein